MRNEYKMRGVNSTCLSMIYNDSMEKKGDRFLFVICFSSRAMIKNVLCQWIHMFKIDLPCGI